MVLEFEKVKLDSEGKIKDICIAFGEFRIFERDRLMEEKANGKVNLGHISFDEWYHTIYNV